MKVREASSGQRCCLRKAKQWFPEAPLERKECLQPGRKLDRALDLAKKQQQARGTNS